MLITIDTEEALKFSLSVQDLAVLDVIRRLLAADGGAVEAQGTRQFKWLSNSIILRHLQCSSFRSPRQLHNIIKKLCAVGLLIKNTYYGKPYYSAILRTKAKAAKAAPRQNRDTGPTNAAAQMAQPTAQPAAKIENYVPEFREPSPDELAAALQKIDKKADDVERRAAERRAKSPVNALVPNRTEIAAHAVQNRWTDFDIDGFITFNSERNWSALRRETWRALAQRWYEQQCKKMAELITYEKYCELTNKDRSQNKLWTFHHKDTKTGVSWFCRTAAQKMPPPSENCTGSGES